MPSLELKHLKYLVAIIDTGSFTDAAIELGVSQAAVSRTLAGLETLLEVRLLHRTSRSVAPTTAGIQVLARARVLLSGAEALIREATTGHSQIRIGHAWSAFGRRTAEFQRRWHENHPEIELRVFCQILVSHVCTRIEPPERLKLSHLCTPAHRARLPLLNY